jgi:hypothetical protein
MNYGDEDRINPLLEILDVTMKHVETALHNVRFLRASSQALRCNHSSRVIL